MKNIKFMLILSLLSSFNIYTAANINENTKKIETLKAKIASEKEKSDLFKPKMCAALISFLAGTSSMIAFTIDRSSNETRMSPYDMLFRFTGTEIIENLQNTVPFERCEMVEKTGNAICLVGVLTTLLFYTKEKMHEKRQKLHEKELKEITI